MNKLIDTQLQDFLQVDIKTVYPNENQPRKTFNNLDELASSIKIHGLLEPVAVVKFDKGFMIVDGERRFKACNKLNHTTIKIQIFDFDEAQIDEISLVKARQRQDLTPFEYAKKIGEMWNSGRYKKKEHLARAIGESQTFISKCFSSLRLDPSIVTLLEADRLTVPLSVLEEIGRIKDTDLQCEIYDKYVNEEITRDEIKDYKQNFPAGKKEEKVSNFNTKPDEHKEEVDIDDFIPFKYIITLTKKITSNFSKGLLFDLPFGIKGIYTINDINIDFYEFQTGVHIGFGNLSLNSLDEMIEKVYKHFLGSGANHVLNFFKRRLVINDTFEHTYIKVLNDIAKESSMQKETINDIDEIAKLQNENKRLKEENEQLKKELESLKNSTQEKPKSFKEQYEESKNLEQPVKEETKRDIRHIEISDSIYIEYTDMDCDTVSYSKAKQIIKELQTTEFTYVSNGSEKAHNFINSIPKYGSDHNKIVLKDKYRVN